MKLHWPSGALSDSDPVSLTPEQAAWRYCGLRVARVAAAGERTIATGPDEMAVLPLSGSVVVEVDGERFVLGGRDDVFSRVTDWAYVPRDAEVRLSSAAGAEVALPSARADHRLPAQYVPADAVPVEVRGAGPATRQVTNFCAPDVFAGADRLMAVELLTPDGNWSSYPPHRHDDSAECPVNNEEIYYFRIQGDGGFGFHRLYTPDGDIDEHVVVGDGDVFLIPRGYHGPCVAAPGYTMYYLNVLAGPADERSMAFCDDPAHHWVRDTWGAMPTDPRCPMTSAAGPVRA
jgi:5-deoxy-glucuronate isomerase